MRSEIIEELSSMSADTLKKQMILISEKATLAQVEIIASLLKFQKKHTVTVGNIAVTKRYYQRIKNSGILDQALEVISIASERYPINTLDVLIFAGFKNITKSHKLAAGHLLTLAGFKRVSLHRTGQTPTKSWVPIDKTVDDRYRAEYFFSLLKNIEDVADTKALDDLI